jgi:hypothetical protein
VRSTEPIKFRVIRLAAPAGGANINEATKLRTRILVVGGTTRVMDLLLRQAVGERGELSNCNAVSSVEFARKLIRVFGPVG